jgi:antirestriction protein ArdC
MSDIHVAITEQVITALEAGTQPWVCPWKESDGDMAPANLSTRRPYRGVNVLLLNLQTVMHGYISNHWLTYQQSRSLGAQVRKGESGTQVIFYKMHQLGAPRGSNPDTDVGQQVIPLLRTFTVFNASQIDGLPPALLEQDIEPCGFWDAGGTADGILRESNATIKHGGSRAFYAPTDDFIQLPPQAAFDNATDYYSTALHELTHWTGHPHRCNRILGHRHGIDAYAFEELVAEMGAAFLTNHCRLPGKLQHASYIASWLHALRNDQRLIFAAAAQAQKAADYLLPPTTKKEVVLPLADAA